MNLRKTVVSSFATMALLFGMTGGLVNAANDDGVAEVNVVCEPATGVTVTMGDAFEVDLNSGPGPYNAAVSDLITIELDLTCNYDATWVVKTNISDFYFDDDTGFVQPYQTDNFSGGALQMVNGVETFTNVPTTFTTAPATVVGTVTPRNLIVGDIPMAPDWLFIFPRSSPGITTGHWGGTLTNLPPNLAVGTYQADLDVILIGAD